MTGSRRASTFAVLGLTLLFSGIWFGDVQVLAELPILNSYLAMRLISLLIYLMLFLIILLAARYRGKFTKDREGNVERPHYRLLMILGAVGLLLSALGLFLLATRSNGLTGIGGITCLLLIKTSPAPVSVALVYLFARIDRGAIPRASATGIICAFMLEALLGLANTALQFSDTLVFVISWLLIASAFLLTAVALHRPDSTQVLATRTLLRPPREVLGRSFKIEAGVAGLLMGYLRGDAGDNGFYTSGMVALILLVLLVVALMVRTWNLREAYLTAIIVAAAGILLGPLLSLSGMDFGGLLCGVSTALFELALWILEVRCVVNCTQPLLASIGSRLTVVVSHLMGSLLGATAMVLVSSSATRLNDISLCLVFIYLIVVLAYGGKDNRQLAFLPFSFDDQPSEENAPTGSAGLSENDKSPTDALPDAWIHEPCTRIAKAYGLTARETDVLEQLARGRSLPAMADIFVLSTNTIKMHIRHIYDKLDIHSKQELIDMVNKTRAK